MLSSMPASENISFEKIVIFQPHNFTCLCTSPASCGITLISCIHKKNTKTYCSVGVGWIFPVCMELNHWRNQICLYLPLTLLLSMYGLIYSAHELDCLVSPSGDACAERQIWLYSFLTEISRSWRRGLDHFCERAPGSQHSYRVQLGLGLQNLNLSIKGAETWGPDAWELVIHSSKQQYLICASI